jgi:hypothetical protein
MKKEKQIVAISGFIGFSIGVCSMMFVNIDKQTRIEEEMKKCCEKTIQNVYDYEGFTIQENINTCEDMIEWMNEDVWNGRVDSTYYESYIYNLENMIEENRELLQNDNPKCSYYSEEKEKEWEEKVNSMYLDCENCDEID